MAKPGLAGRSLHLSQGGERPSAPTAGSREGNGFVAAWLAKGTACRGRVGEITGATGQRGCDHLVPALGTLTPGQGGETPLVELPPPTPFVLCGGAGLAWPGERRPGRGMRSTVWCCRSWGGHRQPVGARRPLPAACEPAAFAICATLGGWGAQCRASSTPRFPGLFCSCGV